MSAPSYSDEPAPAPASPGRRDGIGAKVVKGVAALAVVVALVFGANAIVGGTNSTATSTSGTQGTTGTTGTHAPPSGAGGAVPPGLGTPVTGATLAKVKAAALAKYPGTVERAFKLADGSYEVHVFKSGGSEVHVLVSKTFAVTGVQAGGPPSGAADQAPPTGQAPSGSSTGHQS